MRTFVDTNVLVYAADPSEPGKHERASEWVRALWRDGHGRTSFQVLHEYYVTVTRKIGRPLEQDVARSDVRNLLAWRPQQMDAAVLRDGWTVMDRFGLSFWDSLIVAAARLQGCERLLTEDLQDGQDLGGIVVVNPFTSEPA